MKANVDKDACIGSGNWAPTCPNVFKVVDRKSQVPANPVPADEERCVGEVVGG
ncbi:MAG: ferredoxin [Desulfobacteraceae bacterium]|jgi:ferredoxin